MGALFLARAFGPMRMFGMGVDGVVMMVVMRLLNILPLLGWALQGGRCGVLRWGGAWPVSRKVNSPMNQGEALMQPIEEVG